MPSADIPTPAPATAALARTMGKDPDLVVLTNGGAEAIALVAAELKVGWVDEPDFSLYRRYLERLNPAAPRWRSNPHNPTGLLAGPGEQAAVWDEAFWPLASGTLDARGLRCRCDRPRLADEAARLSGPAGRVRVVPRRRLRPAHPGPPAGMVGERSGCRRPSRLARHGRPPGLVRGRCRAAARAVRRPATGRFPPETVRTPIWVLVESPDLREHLAARAIAVRDCASFGLTGVVRIAVPGRAGLARLEAAL